MGNKRKKTRIQNATDSVILILIPCEQKLINQLKEKILEASTNKQLLGKTSSNQSEEYKKLISEKNELNELHQMAEETRKYLESIRFSTFNNSAIEIVYFDNLDKQLEKIKEQNKNKGIKNISLNIIGHGDSKGIGTISDELVNITPKKLVTKLKSHCSNLFELEPSLSLRFYFQTCQSSVFAKKFARYFQEESSNPNVMFHGVNGYIRFKKNGQAVESEYYGRNTGNTPVKYINVTPTKKLSLDNVIAKLDFGTKENHTPQQESEETIIQTKQPPILAELNQNEDNKPNALAKLNQNENNKPNALAEFLKYQTEQRPAAVKLPIEKSHKSEGQILSKNKENNYFVSKVKENKTLGNELTIQ